MRDDEHLDDTGEDALTESESVRHVGSFRFFFDSQIWEWSDEVAILHGYQPGEAVPTTELVASHKHPDDREKFEKMLSDMLTHRTPFSSEHRIVDAQGNIRYMTVVAEQMRDDDGVVIGTEGFYLDITGLHSQTLQEVDRHVGRFRETQAVIEQAKGMLMLAYSVSDDRAFEVLRWRSQTSNTKLHVICRNIVDGSRRISLSEHTRQSFDQLLLGSHQSDAAE